MPDQSSRYTPPGGIEKATRGGKLLGQNGTGPPPDAVMVDVLANADLVGAIAIAQGFTITPEGMAAFLTDDQVLIPGSDEAKQQLVNAIGICVEAAKHYAIQNQATKDEEE